MIQTKEIKISSKKLLSILFLEYGMIWLIVAASGFIILLIIGAFLDYRFFVLALIWLFLFIPLIVAFLYFFYGMKPLTVFNPIPHKIFFEDNFFRIHLIEKEINESGLEVDKALNHSHEYIVSYKDFQHSKNGSDSVLLFSHEKGILVLPFFAFESKEDLKNVVKKLII